MPAPRPDELLVRCDAVSLCYSDVKIVAQGGEHVKIQPRNLENDPITMGHEAAVTVVWVGERLRERFHIGERYIVQADIFVHGKSQAFGYLTPGALTQYQILGRPVLDGDDGCYLIPVQGNTGYAEAALTEPWACVVHAYSLRSRRGVLPGGICLIVGGNETAGFHFGDTFAPGLPARVVAVGLNDELLQALETTGVEVVALPLDATLQERLDTDYEQGFDDIIVCGCMAAGMMENMARRLSTGGVMNVVSAYVPERPVDVDVGSIHYDGWRYVGNPGPDIGASYFWERDTTELKVDGSVWFLGAGGPMGQMHIQRACEMRNGPAVIIATDTDETRNAVLRERFTALAQAHDRTLIVLNPDDFTEEAFTERLCELNSGCGFDDVVVLVPNALLIAQGSAQCAYNGLLNIFAGVARGTMCTLDLRDIYLRNVRWVGSSGSTIQDMKEVLAFAESGELRTANAVAAIGGIEAAYHGLELVRDQQVPGKIVIFPQITNLPLTPREGDAPPEPNKLVDLRNSLPAVAALLEEGRYWTREAEEALLRAKLALPQHQLPTKS